MKLMQEKDTKEKDIEYVKNEETSTENVKNNTAQNNIEENSTVENKNTENNTVKNKKEKNLAIKILNVFGKSLGIFIIIFLILILVRALVYKKYDVFGYRFYLIMSGSMEPTIKVSDAVVTKEQDDFKEGDIIAFDYQGAITVHRIIKTYTQENAESLYQTKGDNNNGPDRGLVEKTQIKGKVIFKIPKVGDAIIFLQRNIVIILILIVGVVLIITLVRRLI